jgi:hypothetical protein
MCEPREDESALLLGVGVKEVVFDVAGFEELLKFDERARLLGEGRGRDTFVGVRDATMDTIQEESVSGIEDICNVCGPCG